MVLHQHNLYHFSSHWNHNISIAPQQILYRWTILWQVFFNHITYFQHFCLLTFPKVSKPECPFLHPRNAQSSLFVFLTDKFGETIFQRMLINYKEYPICFNIFSYSFSVGSDIKFRMVFWMDRFLFKNSFVVGIAFIASMTYSTRTAKLTTI